MGSTSMKILLIAAVCLNWSVFRASFTNILERWLTPLRSFLLGMQHLTELDVFVGPALLSPIFLLFFVVVQRSSPEVIIIKKQNKQEKQQQFSCICCISQN